MNILIYIEPLIESGLPLAKRYWVDNWVPRITTSLRAAYGNETKITLVGGSTFLSDIAFPGIEIVAINPWDIIDVWENNPDGILVESFRWGQSPSAKMIASRVKTFIPESNYEVVIVFGAQGYHHNIFPEIPILYHEFSFFKSPGPATWYFDQVGPGGSAWFERFWNSFSLSWRPSEDQLLLADRYRKSYRDAILSRGSLSATVEQFSKKFDKTVLLPLQMDGASVFTAFSPIESQFNLALGVWTRLPPSVGLVITEHPRQMGALTDDSREFLGNLDNVLIIRQGGLFGPSDEAAPFVDGIATVTSTVGALAFLWGKSLISLTGKYLAPFADQLGPPPWCFGERSDAHDLSLLAFMMTHWAVTSRQIEDPEWMRSLITHAVAVRTGHADPAGYPIPAWRASPEAIENAWLSPLGGVDKLGVA